MTRTEGELERCTCLQGEDYKYNSWVSDKPTHVPPLIVNFKNLPYPKVTPHTH